jgi:hypothetical protein
MKRIFTLLFSLLALQATAQFRDTTNLFEDTMHTSVAVVAYGQRNPIVMTSYPDDGYFVVWEDERNMATNKQDIYAQKYDKAGNRLWAQDGIPIANAATHEHYTFSSNQDYRNHNFIVTDSAGGFYLCFANDSVTNYVWERVTVQHVRSNGSKVFPGSGYVFARSISANLNMMPKIIADGKKGFYLAYKEINSNEYINAACYRDENGVMKYYGGGRMNENAVQTSTVYPCGIKTDVVYPGTNVIDYAIWPDGQDGCNILMVLNGNTAGQHAMLGYNRLWRAKKDSKVRTYFRNTSGTACPRITEYKKDDVYPLYKIVRDFQSVACGGSGSPLYTYTNYRLLSNGFFLIDHDGYDYSYPKGVTMTTTGNVNVDVMAVTRRTYGDNIVSDFIIYGYAYPSQKFDSVPYQRATYSNPEIGYNPVPNPTTNKLNFFRDTLLAFSNYFPDFSIAGNGNQFYATGVMAKTGNRKVLVQHLTVTQKAPDSFAVEYYRELGKPYKHGRAIGGELIYGTNGAGMSFDVPHITVTRAGKAFFSVLEGGRSPRISPISSGWELDWGAMGRTISTGAFAGNYYTMEQPVLAVDSGGTRGIVAWRDNKYIPGTNDNIYMRQINKLGSSFYRPPVRKVKPLYYTSGEVIANPAVLYGTSRQYTNIDLYNGYNGVGTSPVADILDRNYLGQVKLHAYQYNGPIRRFNNRGYLGRNYTIKTDSMPPGAVYDMLLYFTTEEFNALKATDPTISNPGDLIVLRQPNATETAPSTYSPVAGEEILGPVIWDSVSGGYFLKVEAHGLGNFFFQKMPTATLCKATSTSFTSPVTGTTYQWQVSTDGKIFSNISNGGNYSGATTITLQINNIPSSFNGYRYRCVVNTLLSSNMFYLQVANTWTGAVNNQWETGGNWSCGTVPDANTDAIINSGTVTVNSTTAICRTLQVRPTANVSVGVGFKLTVTK